MHLPITISSIQGDEHKMVMYPKKHSFVRPENDNIANKNVAKYMIYCQLYELFGIMWRIMMGPLPCFSQTIS